MLIYILFINILAFTLYGTDKYLAKKKLFRISEKLLLLVSSIGAPYGSLLGSYTFHHKTKKIKFKIWNVLMSIVWLFLLISLII